MRVEKIECKKNTLAGPVDENVLRWFAMHRNGFDRSFLEDLPNIHGGVPKKAFFEFRNSKYRIGRFLTFVKDSSVLSPPHQDSWERPGFDIRLDRSAYNLLVWEGASCKHLFGGVRLTPFAALYTNSLSPDEVSLRHGESDLLCFDSDEEKQMHRVVIWNSLQAGEEYIRTWNDEQVDYNAFTYKIANSWIEFTRLLH